jgi:hypothetical protein
MSAPTVAQIVAANIDELRSLPSHRELAAWAEEHNLMTQARFPRFKLAAAEIVDAHPHGSDAVGIKRITGTGAFAANTVAITNTEDSE